MKLMLDTNVILDVFFRRPPDHESAVKVVDACEQGRQIGYVSATTITTLFYLVHKHSDQRTASSLLEKLLGFCVIAEVNDAVVRAALRDGFHDFEDSVLHQAALRAGCEGIVTRDPAGFRKAALRIYSPKEICVLLSL